MKHFITITICLLYCVVCAAESTDPASLGSQENRRAAEQGDATAQSSLGIAYELGEGVPQDYVEAAKWYRKAAEQGNAAAQNNLGVMYAFGQSIPQNDAEAYFWAILASVNGDENRAKARDEVAQRLTPEQRAAVQNRAAAWRPSKPE